jgi:glycosyltransferase involved in cell wall biosynthesis
MIRALGRIFSPYVDGIIYNAEQALDFHRAIGFREPRALVIPNCLDTVAFQRDPAARIAVRRELGIPNDAIVVVMAARVDAMKDWGGLLDTVRDLPGIVAVGIGLGTDQLPAQPGFLGLGWRDDVARIYSAADIFLLTSAFGEGTSLALVEAMACTLPSVVTDVGGNGTIVAGAGIVVPPGDVSAAQRAVMHLARAKILRDEMGARGRARVASGHSADYVAALIDGLTRSAREAACPASGV